MKKLGCSGPDRVGLALVCAGIILLGLAAAPASANEGVFLLGYDTVMLQRGNSGVASPRNASWMFMNPASIIELDRRLDLNLYTVFTDVSLNPGGLIGNFLVDELQSESPFYVPSG
ncbi:MAG: hypothetical protein IT368_10755, partial [Candidatus Hydrogenedentes bacterium]|nr:hypothetical protein [Candidatus Hydrogenedentota bacterium]